MESSATPVARPTGQSLEMAYVLFVDLVGYSLLSTDAQEDVVEKLQRTICETAEFKSALSRNDLICLPTGDGMALVFFHEPEAPVRCALELTKALRQSPEVKIRMGIHSGPVYRRADINANLNVAGGGINVAQRVMDCGDAGHILVSKAAAEVLSQVGSWNQSLHDLREAEVKHGQRVHLFNLWTEEVGNREEPARLRLARAKRVRRALALALAAGLTVAGLSSWLIFGRKAHALGQADTIVLADFDNKTGDPVFDDTLRQGLAVQLEQSPFLFMISDSKVNQTLKLMKRQAGDPLTPDVTREVCQRTGSKAMITGSIAGLGSQYVIGLKAVNCQSGDALADAQEQAAGKEAVLKALDTAAVRLRRKLGESLSTIQKYDTPIYDATTPSLEALKASSLGIKIQHEKGNATAIPFYKRAIELDSNFATAYANLGISYSNLGETGLASENFQKAYEQRDHVSEREKFHISAFYYSFVTGELGKAIQIYELWAQAYPRDVAPHVNLGFSYAFLGQYEKALVETLESLRVNPDAGDAYGNLMSDYAFLNRLDEAKATYQQAIARKLEHPFLHSNLYGVAFLQGDAAEMESQVAWATGKPGAEDVLLSYESDTEAFSGHLGKARDLSRRADESAKRADEKETAAEWQMNGALREAEFGNAAQARHEAASALALASTRDVQILAALALARAGDSARAQKMADELEKQNPLNTVIISYWLPTIRAGIEINRNNVVKAVELLQAATPYELGYPLPEVEFGGFLYPAYVRGQAYLLLQLGHEATSEFQKILDHRSLIANSPLGALAHLGLARAYAQQGDTAKAKAAYQDFLTLWKDADPDIPILKQAKAEYAKLQ